MNPTIRDRDIIAVVRALDEAAEFNRRAKTCPRQHRRSLYRHKDSALQKALTIDPNQFYIDDNDGGNPPVLGISHTRSSRRFHVRPDLMPVEIQDMLAEMSMTAEADNGLCGMQPARK